MSKGIKKLKNYLDKFFFPEVKDETGSLESFEKKIISGEFKDKNVYGVLAASGDFFTVAPVESPGALFCGGMGSGKSVGLRFTLFTHILTNSENTLYILVDPIKGMMDCQEAFPLEKNVAIATMDAAKFVPVIDMVYTEILERQKKFAEVGAENYLAYDRIMKSRNPDHPGVGRIVIAVEEFHMIPKSEYIKYDQNYDRNGTTAAMMRDILKVGRSYGVQLMAATQRASSDDFPSGLKVGITQMFAFRVNNPTDASVMNLPKAADIPSNLRGRCETENGQMQYPYIKRSAFERLVKKYYKPFKAELFKYQVGDYQRSLAGEGNGGMIYVKPLKTVMINMGQFKFTDIARRVLEIFKFNCESQNNPIYVINMIAERDGKRYGVFASASQRGGYDSGSSDGLTPKKIPVLKDAVEKFNLSGLIVIQNQSLSPGIENAIKKENLSLKVVELEDLNRIADVFDNRPSINESISEEEYEKLFSALPLARTVEAEEEEEEEEEFSILEDI